MNRSRACPSSISGRFDEKLQKATVTTGEDGTAAIEWPAGRDGPYVWGSPPRMPKLVPIHILWDDQRHPLELPAMKELRFEPGTTIGGIVQDEAGHPIEGATVDVHAPADRVRRDELRLHAGIAHDGRPGPMAAGRRAEGPGRGLGPDEPSALSAAAASSRRATSTA